ncbi:ornithine cyclodeaminase family protein [Arthrobacter sp. H14]|uniref:ornithine cyclodeaminase family protein n=1 Tax=Arthrobacter sp. H14 TaxID=1312959 RepID=UPI00047EDFB8|nr:ornithine cyclodeaminase family protein [Arthrobacter sp. H14]
MTADTGPQWYSAADITARISPGRARRLIQQVLQSGFDPASDPERINSPAGAGHLLLMPSVLGDWAGIKVASVAPDNPARGLPRIQATYLLMDAQTLTTQAILQGSVLTTLRTPAMSAVAADTLAAPEAGHLVVFGTGPQALAHIQAFADIRALSRISVVGRNPAKVDAAVVEARSLGLPADPGTATEAAEADIIVCATSAAEPLFDGPLVKDGACVVAMGSHEADRRELDSALMGRSLVVVEDIGAALREAGDVVMSIDDGALDRDALVPIRDVITGAVTRADDRPNVFKGVGMSWQDLAVARGVVEPEL